MYQKNGVKIRFLVVFKKVKGQKWDFQTGFNLRSRRPEKKYEIEFKCGNNDKFNILHRLDGMDPPVRINFRSRHFSIVVGLSHSPRFLWDLFSSKYQYP